MSRQLVGGLSHDLQGFICPKWCEIDFVPTVGVPNDLGGLGVHLPCLGQAEL